MQEFDLIETPENVELRQPLAGIGSRFMAGLIDHLIIFVCLIVLILFLWLLGVLAAWGSFDQIWDWAFALVLLVAFLIYWGYFVLFEFTLNGQSPGKKRMGIRVVREGGVPLAFSGIAIRNLLRPVDFLPGGYAVAGLCMFLTRKMQRLGDLAAGTVVILELVPDYTAGTHRKHKVHLQRQITAEALRATGLRPEEYQVLVNYWARRTELNLEARRRILPQILAPILKRTAQPPIAYTLEGLEAYVGKLIDTAEAAERSGSQEGQTQEPLS